MRFDHFLRPWPDLFPRCRYFEFQGIVAGAGAAIEADNLADLNRFAIATGLRYGNRTALVGVPAARQ